MRDNARIYIQQFITNYSGRPSFLSTITHRHTMTMDYTIVFDIRTIVIIYGHELCLRTIGTPDIRRPRAKAHSGKGPIRHCPSDQTVLIYISSCHTNIYGQQWMYKNRSVGRLTNWKPLSSPWFVWVGSCPGDRVGATLRLLFIIIELWKFKTFSEQCFMVNMEKRL